MSNSFQKSERLYKKREIEHVFSKGNSFVEYPFKVVYIHKTLEDSPLKLAVSIPKKKHSKAVDRNLLKRRVREAYRTNNQALKKYLSNSNMSIHFFLIYLSAEKLPFQNIEDKIILLLQRLEKVDGKIAK